jgi:Rad3-related DNA helicase
MVTLVQASGRGCRAPDDRCETFVVDDQVEWFMTKYRRFAPRWFLDAYVPNVVVTPRPLPKLAPRAGY